VFIILSARQIVNHVRTKNKEVDSLKNYGEILLLKISTELYGQDIFIKNYSALIIKLLFSASLIVTPTDVEQIEKAIV